MVAAHSVEKAQYRLASHYTAKLRTADDAFRRGHENAIYALQLFDQERLLIEHWQRWTLEWLGK